MPMDKIRGRDVVASAPHPSYMPVRKNSRLRSLHQNDIYTKQQADYYSSGRYLRSEVISVASDSYGATMAAWRRMKTRKVDPYHKLIGSDDSRVTCVDRLT